MYAGEKVRLRAYRREDLPLAQQYLNNYEVRKYLAPDIPYPYTLEDETKWYESQSATRETYSFAIETLDEERYIGGCGINRVDWKNRVAEVGIFIGDPHFWGKGYGTDAMRVMIYFAFHEMNMNNVSLTTYSFNQRAIKSYEKCGLKREGVLRQEIFRNGAYHDKIVMGLLQEEYEGSVQS